MQNPKMRKKNKWINVLSCAMVVIAFLLMLLFALFTYGTRSVRPNTKFPDFEVQQFDKGCWYVDTEAGKKTLTEPSRIEANAVGEPLVMHAVLPNNITDKDFLFFQTRNEEVDIQVRSRIIYEYTEEEQMLDEYHLDDIWHLIPLSEEYAGEEITVELIPLEESTGLVPYEFIIGTRGDILVTFFFEKAPEFYAALILFVIFLIMLLTSIVSVVKKDPRAEGYFHFSMLALLASTWTFADSSLMQFIISDKAITYVLFTMSFYMLGLPFVLYIATLLTKYRRPFRIFALVYAAYVVVRFALFMFAGVPLYEWLIILHLFMAAALIASILVLLKPAKESKSGGYRETFVAVIVLATVSMASLVIYYVGNIGTMHRSGFSVGFFIGIFAFIIIAWLGTFRKNRDLQKELEKAAEVEKRAYTDELTGLLNSKGFDEQCTQFLKHAPDNRAYAIVDFDIDYFSQYNSINGWEKGNRVLKAIAEFVRIQCEEDEFCARLDADHFACFVCGETFEDIVNRIREAEEFASEYLRKHMLVLSFGVTEIKDKTMSVTALRNEAVLAKSTVKGNYEQLLAVYDNSIYQQRMWESELYSGFEEALKKGDFVPFLQPKINAQTGELSGAEALVRKLEADGSITPAGKIVDVLEKKGFIRRLDFYMLERVCEFLSNCLDEKRKVVPISINFSRAHLYDSKFVAEVAKRVDEYGLPHKLIEVELTESVFVSEKAILKTRIAELHEAGFLVSIDDFGSGYSSLNMLKDVNIDVVKLDREFLNDIMSNDRARMVVEQILELAQGLALTTVAEGVEEAEQVELLQKIGCNLIQGYYYSRPIPVAEFIEKYLPYNS